MCQTVQIEGNPCFFASFTMRHTVSVPFSFAAALRLPRMVRLSTGISGPVMRFSSRVVRSIWENGRNISLFVHPPVIIRYPVRILWSLWSNTFPHRSVPFPPVRAYRESSNMRAHLCFYPSAIPDPGSHRLPSPAEGVPSWLLASGQSGRKCPFYSHGKVPRLKHTVRACRSETSQDLICQQLSGAYTFFKEFRLLNGCSYET